MKKCTKCGETLELSKFSKNAAKKDGLQGFCKDCMKEFRAGYYERNKEVLIAKATKRKAELRDKLWSYKQGKKCMDCPQTDPRTLEFDHTSDDKLAAVSQMVNFGRSWSVIKNEIDKCDIVCASCHRIRTHVRAGYVRNIVITV